MLYAKKINIFPFAMQSHVYRCILSLSIVTCAYTIICIYNAWPMQYYLHALDQCRRRFWCRMPRTVRKTTTVPKTIAYISFCFKHAKHRYRYGDERCHYAPHCLLRCTITGPLRNLFTCAPVYTASTWVEPVSDNEKEVEIEEKRTASQIEIHRRWEASCPT